MIEYKLCTDICLAFIIGFGIIAAVSAIDRRHTFMKFSITVVVISCILSGSAYLIRYNCPQEETVTKVNLTSVGGNYLAFTGEYADPTVYVETDDVYKIKTVSGAVICNTTGEAFLETKKTFSKFWFIKVGTTENIIHVPK